jgi:hypothetical protein
MKNDSEEINSPSNEQHVGAILDELYCGDTTEERAAARALCEIARQLARLADTYEFELGIESWWRADDRKQAQQQKLTDFWRKAESVAEDEQRAIVDAIADDLGLQSPREELFRFAKRFQDLQTGKAGFGQP